MANFIGTLSPDGRYRWDGSAWQPVTVEELAAQSRASIVAPPKKKNLWWVWPLVIIGVVGAIALGGGGHTSTPQMISNAKIDSGLQIEFDYYASTSCGNLTFQYAFYDSNANQLGLSNGAESHSVSSGKSYHVTVAAATLDDRIPANATNFTVSPRCAP
jgi:hypothetical protein